MNRKAVIPVMGFVIIAGCSTSPKGWEQSGVAKSQLDADKAQCEYEAKAATASYRTTPTKKGESAALGTAIGDGIVVAEKRVELTNDCMKARGYVPR